MNLADFGLEQPLLPWLAIPIILLLYFYLCRKSKSTWGKRIFLLSRFLLFSLILIALASPYLIQIKDEFQTLSVKILSDSSRSMDLFPQELGQAVHSKINPNQTQVSFKLNLREISAESERTELGNALYQEAIQESRDNLLIITSDGNNNYGRNPEDVARILQESSKIFILTPNQTSSEIYLSGIGGDKKIPVNTEYTSWVEISKVGGEAIYYLRLFVDRNKVKDEEITQSEKTKRKEFTFSFIRPGVHLIEVEIVPRSKDYFAQNNKISKVVDVVERPRVLVVSESENSPLVKVLEKNYRVHLSPSLEKNFQTYDLVILDDQPREALPSPRIDALSKYLTDGNGLVIIGGENSFERGNYINSNLERILPVTSTEKPEEKRNPIAVVFCFDVSASMAYPGELGYQSYLEESKAIAINLLRQLSPEDSVAVVAFNVPVWTLIDLIPVEENLPLIEENILKLKPAAGGGTRFLPPLSQVESILTNYDHERYVVFLSDGVPAGEDTSSILSQATTLGNKNIKVHAVSVGNRAQAREGQQLMQSIAEKSNGLYYWMEEGERLKAVFKEEEQAEVEGMYPLKIYDKYHFITQDLDFNAKLVSYNGVTAKSISRVLVSTLDKSPIVTAWRFGLGRVVAITTDNGADWSSQLYQVENGKLISRITNWAMEDLEKGREVRLSTHDISLGETALIQVNLKSEFPKKPQLYLEKDGKKEELKLKQVDLNKFSSSLTPSETGIFELVVESPLGEDTDAIAVNPPLEYATLGVNQERLGQIAKISNGQLYNYSQIDEMTEEILKNIKEGSLRKVKGKDDLTLYFLLAALGLFFIDVVARRIKDLLAIRQTG